VEPSGVFFVGFAHLARQCDYAHAEYQGYNGAAVGKGRQLAKTELEKLKLSEISTREAVIEAARMFVCPLVLTCSSNNVFQHISSTRRCEGEGI
jgi:20S proteasome alpha/beta subunit